MSSGATNQEDGMDDIRSEIDRRLRDDGISTDCTDDQKLVLVWKLYLHTEATLQTAIENEEKLKVAQTAEMQEVENYVEHIRHLSDEREALIQELETENDSLKMEIEMLKSDQNVSALRDETAEMLTQQGLEEIASVSTSEQIAFLLVERARLLDELEAEQNRSATPSPGRSTSNADDLQKTLEKERQEMQETLTQQQEQMKSLKDSLREDHEEEINLLMEENNKLEEDLQLGKRKVSELEKENAQLKDEIQNLKEKDKSDPDSRASTPRHNRPPSPGRTQNDVAIRNIIQEKTKIEGELVSQRSQLRNLQNENEKLTSRAEELEKEMENVKSLLQQQQHKNKMLKSELEETEQQLDDAENVAEDLTMEANKLKDTLTLTEAEVKELRAQLQQSDNMQDIVEILSNEKEQMTTELDTLKRELEEYAAEKEDLSNTLRLSSHKEEKLQEEIQNLQLSLESVQNKDVDLKSQKEELQKIKMLLETTKLELISVSNERDKFCSDKENLSKQNKELLNRLESIENDLRSKNISEGQEAAKQEIIINHIKEQNQKLSKDLHSLSSQIEEKNKKLEESLQKVEELQSENKDIGLKYNKELDDLRNKLQLTFSELGKSKSLLEEQYEQNSDLQDHIQKLESSLNEISASKSASNSDKDNLIQELRTKIEELEKTVSEKVSYEKLFEVKRDEIRQLERQLDDYEAVKTELDDTIHQLEKEKAAKAKLEVTVNDLEQIIDDQRQDNDKTQHSLLDKLQTHQNRIKALQDDLFTAQDELHNMREMHDKDLQKAHAITKELQDRLDIQKQQSIQAEVISATQRIEAQKLENLQRQIETMKVRLQEATLHNEGLSKDKSSLEHQVRVLEETVKQNDIYCQEVEQLRRELSSIQRERDHLQLATKYNEDDRQRHIDRIKSLEEISKQLELDNREVSSKLTEAEAQLEHLEDQLRKEKHKVTERQYLSNNRLSKVEKELTDTTKQSRELRDELQKKQTYIMKLEADAIGNAAKYESTIARLESELTDFKQYNKKELESTQDRLDVANRELKEIRDLLRDKEQELSQALQESSRLKGAMDRMEAQLQTEVKIRTDMENRNSSLDQEVTKVWNQVKSLMDQNSSLEAAKRSLEDELERKKSASRYSESNFLQSSASQEAALKQALNRAEMADKRADRLQKDYNELTFKLKSLEHQVTQAEDIKSTLHDKKEQVSQLRNQLETEKLQRTLLDQTVSELKHQISLLKQRETKVTEQNCELQHTILDLEAKLEDLHERSQTAMEMDYNYLNGVDNKQQHLTEVGKRSMLDQIGQLQKEVKDLQYELLTVNERREVQERKYEERKLKTKSKLMKARDFYTKEKTRLQEQIGRMDEDLRMTRETLRKEMDWKEKMDKNYQSILHEKRDLLSQLADQEDTMREKTRMVTTLQVKSKYLEEENSRLMDRLETMTSPKVGLSKVLKTYKSGRERELTRALSPAEAPPHSFTGGTSGLGNSVDSSWTNEHDHYADHNILGFRSQTGTSNVDNYLNRNFCSSRTDLFRPHSPSEDSFTHEFDT